MEQLGSQGTYIREIWYLSIFRKSVGKNSSFIKIWREKRVLFIKTYATFHSISMNLFLERNHSHTGVVEQIRPRISCSMTTANRATDVMWENAAQPDRSQTTVRRIRTACWKIKSTHKHTQNMWSLLIFQGNNGYANAPQCYVTRMLVLFSSTLLLSDGHSVISKTKCIILILLWETKISWITKFYTAGPWVLEAKGNKRIIISNWYKTHFPLTGLLDMITSVRLRSDEWCIWQERP